MFAPLSLQATFCWTWMGWNWRGWREARQWPTWRTPPPPWCSRSWRCVVQRKASRSARCRPASQPHLQTAPRARCPTMTTPRCGCHGCSSPGEFLTCIISPPAPVCAASASCWLSNSSYKLNIHHFFYWLEFKESQKTSEFRMHEFIVLLGDSTAVTAAEQKESFVLHTINWLQITEQNHQKKLDSYYH